ncbi:PH domain-containing protein [Tepidiforma sp.]|uniref:PH domain-containing protein n=1 Tax=Tepidiforma sp. TaxID=2682230 RepID=UPI002ADD5AF4|nr:PH domain-containing protein [Tepidiforma sp.]
MVHAGAGPRHPLSATVFQPPRALGVIVAGAFAAWAFAVAFLSGSVASGADPSFKTFLAWGAAAAATGLGIMFAAWAYALFTLAYVVDNGELQIRWGFRRVVVPIGAVQRLVPGRTLDPPEVSGLNWWGCHIGSGAVRRVGYVLFYSTHSSPDELLYVVTDGEVYGLTVTDQAAFAEAIQARASVAPFEAYPMQRSEALGPAALPFWRDRTAMAGVAVAAALCAVVAGYVFTSYPGLPQVVELSFPELGGIVRVGDRSEILGIAYLAVGVLAANSVAGVVLHAFERAAGLWLIAAGAMLQAVLLGAALVALSTAG